MLSFSNFLTQKFPAFIFLYFALQILIRLMTTNIAILDESEQIMLSQYFDFGYNEQPPLYTWLQIGVFKLFGTNIFSLSILKNSLLFVTCLFVYKLGILLMGSRLKASLGAISLLLLPQFVWDAQVDQTHTILLTMATAITIYYFFKISKEEASTYDFIIFGISIGVGFNAKYNFILVVVSLIIISLLIKEFRSRFYEKRLLLSIGITLVMVLPHFLWFISHLDIATTRTIQRMNEGKTQSVIIDFFKGNFSLIQSTIAYLAPFLIIFFLLFKERFSFSLKNKYAKALLLYMLIILAFLFIIVTASGTTHIRARWLQPFLFLAPLFLFLHIDLFKIDKKTNIFISISLFVAIVVALIILIKPYMIDFRGKPTRTSHPFIELSKNIESKITSTKDTLFYVENIHIGGNLKLFLPDAVVITPAMPHLPYTLKNEIALVWENYKPKAFIRKLEKHSYKCLPYKESLPYQHSEKLMYHVNYEVCSKH